MKSIQNPSFSRSFVYQRKTIETREEKKMFYYYINTVVHMNNYYVKN